MIRTEIIKKTEKIASAAYLLTGFFDDQEPLKWRIRGLSSELVSRAVSLKDTTVTLSELSSLLTVAKNAGLISDTNHSIISQEVERHLGKMDTGIKSLFVDELPEASVQKSPAPTDTALPKPIERADEIKDKTPQALIAEPAKEKTLREFGAVAMKKNSRQNAIIALLKRKKEIMIKDVVPLIDGVSEKTIQRELLSMVEEGILHKMGEKRWSRYSLAN